MVKVGLVTGPVTPSARSAPRTNVVLPAPSSPESSTTSPGRSSRASSAPSASVSAADAVCSAGDAIGGAAPERQARHEQHPAAGRDETGVGPGARERRRGRRDARGGRGGAGVGLRRGFLGGCALLRRGRALGLRGLVPERVLVLIVAG